VVVHYDSLSRGSFSGAFFGGVGGVRTGGGGAGFFFELCVLMGRGECEEVEGVLYLISCVPSSACELLGGTAYLMSCPTESCDKASGTAYLTSCTTASSTADIDCSSVGVSGLTVAIDGMAPVM
jgi:hypothetical protein